MAMSKHPQIGIQDVVYATLTESTDVVGGTPTYGTVYPLAGAMKFNTKHNGSAATLFADDGAAFSATTVGKTQVSCEFYDILPDAYAAIVGISRANGINADSSLDTAPYVAVGYKSLKAGLDSSGNPVYVYRWILKGKFTKADEGGETKKDTLNYTSVALNAEFVKLQANGYYQTSIRTDDTAVSSTTVTNWFNAPVISNSADLNAFTLTSAAASISTKTFTLTFAKAGGGTTTVYDGASSNVIISVGSTGTQVALTTFTPGSASTTPTLAVVTSATLTGVPYTIVVTAGLHDASGVPCVQKVITVTPA